MNEALLKYRCKNNLTQGELAEKCNVSKVLIYSLENGRYKSCLKKNAIEKIINVVGCSPYELMDFERIFYYTPSKKEDFDVLINLLQEEKRKRYGD